MKKHIISLAMLFAVCGSAFGQTAYLEDILIQNRSVEKTGARRVKVSMDFDLTNLDIKRQHSLRLVPVIVAADGSQEQELPPLVVEGKVRYKVNNRVERLDDVPQAPDAVARVSHRNRRGQTVAYEADVPFRRWMIGSDLQVRAYTTGCASCAEGDETGNTGTILPPMNPVYYYPFIQPMEEVVKRRSETRAARLQFRQDSHQIDEKYQENRAELDKVRESLTLVKDNNDLTITGIYVTGYASPEGTFDYNMKLSERRAKAFTEYVKDDMKSIDPSLYHVSWKGEDWEGLRAEVEKRPGLLKQDEVLDIIDNCGDDKDACEERLKAMVPPEIYERLLNEMYGPVRRNEYRIEYNVRHFDLEEGKKMIKTRPELMSVSEIQKVADSYGKGNPEYIASLMAGAKAYPDNVTAVNNAALALIEAGRAAEAVALLEKSPKDGALLNMLGVAYINQGEYAKAESAFEQAVAKGYAKSGGNLDLLRGYAEYMAE